MGIATGIFADMPNTPGYGLRPSRSEQPWLDEVSWASCRSARHTRWAWCPWVCTEEPFGDSCLHPLEAHSCSVLQLSLQQAGRARRVQSLRLRALQPLQFDSELSEL